MFVDSHAITEHCKTKDWPTMNSYVPSMKNTLHINLINPNKVLMPRIEHPRLELIKSFVKAMVKHRSNDFEFFSKKFSKLSQIKLKEGIFLVHRFRKFWKTQSLKKL